MITPTSATTPAQTRPVLTQTSQNLAAASSKTAALTAECECCKNRKYQDGSNDPGVSFKSATRVAPQASAAAVSSHEQEHVSRERSKADGEGREVVYQSVRYSSDKCPECGKVYISGGETTTATRSKPKSSQPGVGESIDSFA